jgi:hypothetical protein
MQQQLSLTTTHPLWRPSLNRWSRAIHRSTCRAVARLGSASREVSDKTARHFDTPGGWAGLLFVGEPHRES